MPTMQEVVYEVMCSAIHQTPWARMLGERPSPLTNGATEAAYWRLCEHPDQDLTARQDPKQVMVIVHKDTAGIVSVQVGWLNFSGGTVMRAEQWFRIPTLDVSEATLRQATEEVMVRVLGIYRDVLTGEGVAGDISKLAPDSNAGDEGDEDDMAVQD